jgi:hypothetical protein
MEDDEMLSWLEPLDNNPDGLDSFFKNDQEEEFLEPPEEESE